MIAPENKRVQLLNEIRITHLSLKELLKERKGKKISSEDYEFHKQLRSNETENLRYLYKLQTQLELENKNLEAANKEARKQETKPAAWMAIIIILAIGVLVLSNLGPIQDLTGLAIFSKSETVIQNVNTIYTENSELALNITNATSLRLNGKILGEGKATVYLEMNGQKFVVLDRDNTNNQGGSLITGMAIADVNDMIGEETIIEEINETIIIEENITEEIIPELIENITEVVNETITIEENVTDNVTEDIIIEINESITENTTEIINETVELNLTTNTTIEINETVDTNVTEETIVETNETIVENITEEIITVPEEIVIDISELLLENECLETCDLPISSGKLIIELEGASLEIENIVFTKDIKNTEPVQIVEIENIFLNTQIVLEGSNYFIDEDGDLLTLDIKEVEGVITTIESGKVTLTPLTPGVYETYLYFTDGYNLKRSNSFNITVPDNETFVFVDQSTTVESNTSNETQTIIVPALVEVLQTLTINDSNALNITINIKDKNNNAIGQVKKTVGSKGLSLEIKGEEKSVKVKDNKNNKNKNQAPDNAGLKETTKQVKPDIKIFNIKKAPEVLDIFIDESTQEINNGQITTPVIYIESIEMERAEISLPHDGDVDKILRCRNFIKETFECVSWERTEIPFVKNETHIIFNATRFSGYVGANLTIITPQSYPVKNGEWVVKFGTIGNANLIIDGYDGTQFGVDIEHVSLKCGNTELTAVYDGNSVVYENYECNETGEHVVRVLTDGKHVQRFTFGDSVGYANNFASNVPKTLNIQGKLTNSTGINVNGSKDFVFKIFNTFSGGSNVWNESQTLTVNDGIYDAVLGSNTQLNISFDGQYYLEVVVEGETLTPRINLTSSPYTERARQADYISCENCINSSYITDGTINDSDLASNSVGTDEIMANTILPGDLNTTNSAGASEDDYVLTYDHSTGTMTWAQDSSGTGSSDAGGWLNTSSHTRTALDVNITTGDLLVAAGSIGVGTLTPGALLEVNGDAKITGNLTASELCIGTDCQTSWPSGSASAAGGWLNTSSHTRTALDVNITTGYLLVASGSVGIGNVDPSVALDVTGQIYAESATFPVMGFRRTTSSTSSGSFEGLTGVYSAMGLYTQTSLSSGDGFGGGIVFYAKDSSGTDNPIARIYARKDGADNTGAFQIWTGVEGQASVTTFRADGSVGIGLTSPSEKLSVNGSANITGDLYLGGNLIGSGADLAEKIPSMDKLEAGDVVIIDRDNYEMIKKSDSANSNLVAGVVTTDPAIVIGKEVGGTPIALAGRVPVKVTTENGPIEVGDMLTTASKPGYAMKCTSMIKCFGSVLGKAMEPLESGEGKIIVLINLN